jgi:hypothetical protein
MVHQVHLERLGILKAELRKDMTRRSQCASWTRSGTSTRTHCGKDTENKRFISAQLDKKLTAAALTAAAFAAVVFAAARSGNKSTLGAGRLFGS